MLIRFQGQWGLGKFPSPNIGPEVSIQTKPDITSDMKNIQK
jgi:hypothetical protein